MLLTLPQLAAAQLPAQTPADIPQARFRPTTALVGQVVDYELTFDHDPALEVVFPDSLADFAPFEYVGKTYAPTRTRRGRSRDRATYRLRTFSLAAGQTLALPVLVLRGPRDTLRLRPAPARLRLRRTVAPLPPSAPPSATPPALEADNRLISTVPAFNYPFWLAGAALLLAAGTGAAAVFRTRLRRRYAAYKRRKNHTYFLAQFARHVERFTLSRSATNVERAVTLWKNYLASLETSALNSFTSRELVAFFANDDDVRRALRTTDRVVYGNVLSEDDDEVEQAFERLRRFAENRFVGRYQE